MGEYLTFFNLLIQFKNFFREYIVYSLRRRDGSVEELTVEMLDAENKEALIEEIMNRYGQEVLPF